MEHIKTCPFTLVGLAAAGLVLGVNKIGDFFLFAPPDRMYIDIIISALLVSGGILLDINLSKLAKEKKLKEELELANRELSDKTLRLEESLSRVKVLSGLLPICASCKKIRDDKGYWHRVESYISEHSGAEFTHGYCPDCVSKLYAEISSGERARD